jgi:hypothetical protein
LRDDAIRAESLTQQRIAVGMCDRCGGISEGWGLEQAIGLVGGEQGFDFSTEIVVVITGLVYERRTFSRAPLKGFLDDPVNSLPAILLHKNPRKCDSLRVRVSAGPTSDLSAGSHAAGTDSSPLAANLCRTVPPVAEALGAQIL